ncbi:spindle pole body component 110 isoform X2 [Agrilus planipennis]|uniref:Spindle pole body component 110 isoform X2 n=1 Tax=Agrilus planipennis TaxID=224129 RepID=A0A1W4WTE1_AGRPL|nr:spindle pole body component 110 isoform X2 [Agrilus planipennis]
MSETDLGPRKTLFVIVIVVGCFAVLWPKVFYPMLVGPTHKTHDYDRGCCDVFSDTDVNTIKIISELCSIIAQQSDGKKKLTNQEIASNCRNAILSKCGIDISPILNENVYLDGKVKGVLEKIRSLNGSLCLKYQFNVSPWVLGVPHKTTTNFTIYNVRQERPTHLRPEMLHPALRERGRAIPASSAPRKSPPPKIVEGRPRPIPGMRPPMGGAGHVVPPPQKGTSISIIMPIYTVGIVVFFAYTLIKVIFKKKPEGPGFGLYPSVEPDRLFRKQVFESNKNQLKSKYGRDLSGKLDDDELDLLRRRLRETELAMERIMAQMAQVPLGSQNHTSNGSVPGTKQDQTSVKVLGMETTASCEGGQKWSRPNSPIISPTPPPPVEEPDPPQEIYLEGALPAQSQLLVSDSKTETQPNTDASDDPAVVLASKMTLSVISLDSLPETENGSSSSSGKDREEYEFVSKSDLSSTQHEDERESQKIPLNLKEEFSRDLLQAENISEGEISNDEVDIEIDDEIDYHKEEDVREIAPDDSVTQTIQEKINNANQNIQNIEKFESKVPIFTDKEKHVDVLNDDIQNANESKVGEEVKVVTPILHEESHNDTEKLPASIEEKSTPEVLNREEKHSQELSIQEKIGEENNKTLNFDLQEILKVEEVRDAIDLNLNGPNEKQKLINFDLQGDFNVDKPVEVQVQGYLNLDKPFEVKALQEHEAFGVEDNTIAVKLPQNESSTTFEVTAANNEQQIKNKEDKTLENRTKETEAELTQMATEIIDEITNAAKATFELNNSPSRAVVEVQPILDDDEIFSKYVARVGSDKPIIETSSKKPTTLLLESEISETIQDVSSLNNESDQASEKGSRSLKLSPQGEIIEENYFTLEGSPLSAEEGKSDDMLVVEEVVELSDEEYERLERELEEREREREGKIETSTGVASLISKQEGETDLKLKGKITSVESAKDLTSDITEEDKSGTKENVTDLDEDNDDDLNDFDFNKELERIKREMSAFGITVDENDESNEAEKDVKNRDQPQV